MDKKSFLGFLLIAIIIIFLPKYYEWVNPEYANRIKSDTTATQVDTVQTISRENTPQEVTPQPTVSQPVNNDLPSETYTINTDLYRLTLSNRAGGSIQSFRLKNHLNIENSDTTLVELINEDHPQQSPFISFVDVNKGHEVKLTQNFKLSNQTKSHFDLYGNDSLNLTFTYNYKNKQISRQFTFYGDKYYISLVNDLVKASNLIASENYDLNWNGGIAYTEKDIKNENRYAKAYAYTPADDVEKLEVKDETTESTDFIGNTNWTALRNKYFTIAMVPEDPSGGYVLSGTGRKKEIIIDEDKETLLHRYYSLSMSLPKTSKLSTKLYIGPLKQSLLKEVDENLDNIMSFGFTLIRPISRGVLWLFTNMYKVIPNYGFVLIIFSILVKVLLHPLTVKSTQSMKEMHKLQPKINELKEKYKDDAQKMNQETMKLYTEHGVNPMGGCLPLLLQMPILIALFTVFRSTIQLRHAPFIFWITDLSAPDALFTLPFSIPFYGQYVNLLPMLMAGSQIFMQKMTGQNQNPQQKQMALIMPIMFFFIFNNFPSGLNLYYTLFNILTIVQQQYFTPEPKPKEKKIKKRKSRLERMREIQKKRKNFR